MTCLALFFETIDEEWLQLLHLQPPHGSLVGEMPPVAGVEEGRAQICRSQNLSKKNASGNFADREI